jgi:hypothetical protein
MNCGTFAAIENPGGVFAFDLLTVERAGMR